MLNVKPLNGLFEDSQILLLPQSLCMLFLGIPVSVQILAASVQGSAASVQGPAAPVQCPAVAVQQPALGGHVAVWCHHSARRLIWQQTSGQGAHRSQNCINRLFVS